MVASLGQIFQATWSPDSQGIAYVDLNSNGFYTFELKAAIVEAIAEGQDTVHSLSKSQVYNPLASDNSDNISTSIAWSQTGTWIGLGDYRGNITLFNTETRTFDREFQSHSEAITSLDFSPDGKYLASAGQDGFVRIWDISDGKLLSEYPKGNIFTRQIDFSPDGTMLAFGVEADSTKSTQLTSGVQIVTLAEEVAP